MSGLSVERRISPEGLPSATTGCSLSLNFVQAHENLRHEEMRKAHSPRKLPRAIQCSLAAAGIPCRLVRFFTAGHLVSCIMRRYKKFEEKCFPEDRFVARKSSFLITETSGQYCDFGCFQTLAMVITKLITSAYVHACPLKRIHLGNGSDKAFVDVAGHSRRKQGSTPLASKSFILRHLHK
jgi:hypothetical protein